MSGGEALRTRQSQPSTRFLGVGERAPGIDQRGAFHRHIPATMSSQPALPTLHQRQRLRNRRSVQGCSVENDSVDGCGLSKLPATHLADAELTVESMITPRQRRSDDHSLGTWITGRCDEAGNSRPIEPVGRWNGLPLRCLGGAGTRHEEEPS